jgi:ubiquinone/menaquinone biosynthesis C-methylase UbiE
MPKTDHIGMFTTVDALADPSVFIGLMDRVQTAPDVIAARADLLDRLGLRPGETVLDLGCGTGDHTREVAARLTPGGRAVGVDFSASMIGEATRRQAASAAPAAFEQGDAQHLRFETDTFDACRTERMLCHVPDCRAAIREIARVVRPGGRVGILDVDCAGTFIDSSDRAITAAFVTTLTDVIRNPWIGRTLRRELGEAGLVDVDVRSRVIEIGYGAAEPMIAMHGALMEEVGIDSGAVEAWRQELEYANLSGTFFMGMTMFSAVGRKP